MAASSTRVRVLVTGVGEVGNAVLTQLTSPVFRDRIQAFVLVRAGTRGHPDKERLIRTHEAAGATVLVGDLTDTVASLTALLRSASIQTIVSVVGHFQIGLQAALIEAAEAALVRHFIPSEYGFATEDIPDPNPLSSVLQPKKAIQAQLRRSRLDWTVVHTGAFTSHLFGSTVFGVNHASSAVTAPGAFDAVLQTTPLEDIAMQIALNILDPEMRNQITWLGERISYHDLADILSEVKGRPVHRSVMQPAEAERCLAADPTNFGLRFVPILAAGLGVAMTEGKQKYASPEATFKPTPVRAAARRAIDASSQA